MLDFYRWAAENFWPFVGVTFTLMVFVCAIIEEWRK